jgi:hypothetical protein
MATRTATACPASCAARGAGPAPRYSCSPRARAG